MLIATYTTLVFPASWLTPQPPQEWLRGLAAALIRIVTWLWKTFVDCEVGGVMCVWDGKCDS